MCRCNLFLVANGLYHERKKLLSSGSGAAGNWQEQQEHWDTQDPLRTVIWMVADRGYQTVRLF
jgi:hypothetical protein